MIHQVAGQIANTPRRGGPDRKLRGLRARWLRGSHGPGPGPADPGLPQALRHARILGFHFRLRRRRRWRAGLARSVHNYRSVQ